MYYAREPKWISKPKTPDTRLGRQRLDLNQACSPRIPPRTEHVGRWNASALERFVTIRDGRTTHVSFHVRQPGAASTGRHMAAARTDRQVFRPDGADFCKLWRIAPDINELLPPHVSARQRKLNARIHVSIRGDVGERVSGAAGIGVHSIRPRRRWRRAVLIQTSHQSVIVDPNIRGCCRNPQAKYT